MATIEDALARIDKTEYDIDTPEGEVAAFLRVWAKHDPEAPDLLMANKKTIRGAMDAMRAEAQKKGGTFACIPPAEAAEIILRYFGCPDAKKTLEGGLMYAFMIETVERWAPYGANRELNPQASPKEAKKPQPAAGINLDLDKLLA